MKPNTTRRRFIQASGLAVATTGVSMPVSAQTTDSTQGILADGVAYEADRSAFFSGLISGFGFGSPDPLEVVVDEARNEFNANSDLWVDYGNWLLEEADVNAYGSAEIGVTFAYSRWRWPTASGEIETTIRATYDDVTEQFIDLEWPLESPEDPDFEVTLENEAAENASDDLSQYRRDNLEGGFTLPSNEYLNELAGKYAVNIGVGKDARNVLELLLGWSP
ncbi:twin-arginine translocation signal domain-containing protein [Saliphagus sp. GCM10025334]